MDRPWGFQEFEVLRFSDDRHTKVVRLSALRTGRLYPQEIFLVHISFSDWVNPKNLSAARRIMSMKNSNNTIGNRTCDLPTCSAVPRPTAPPSALHLRSGIINLLICNLNHRELERGEWSNSPFGLKGGQPFYWRLDRHQNRSGQFGEKKIPSRQSLIEPRLTVMKPVTSALQRRIWNLMYQIRNTPFYFTHKKESCTFSWKKRSVFSLKYENYIFVWKKIIVFFPKRN
jgi:hypothetical protein